MSDFMYWLQYFIPIFFGVCFVIMIFVVIVQAEIEQYKKRKRK